MKSFPRTLEALTLAFLASCTGSPVISGDIVSEAPGEAPNGEAPPSPGSPPPSAPPDMPPVDERVGQDRVEAGLGFYTSKACVVCHGEDGRTNVGQNVTLFNCPSCGSWTALREAIEVTMPPASGNLRPSDCVGPCAERTADWIWAEVNGWTLTEEGGTRPSQGAVNLGRNTRRIKTPEALRADFARIFGRVPDFLEDSSGSFVEAPDYWFQEAKLGAVTLNVLVNAAVEACGGESMPALEAAAVQAKCGEWARRMWLREASPDELRSCVDTAITVTRDLANPQQQLEFTCASMMVSIPSLTF